MKNQKENGSNLPTVFTFSEKNKVRVISHNEQSWFAAIDICSILRLSNSRIVVGRLEDDERCKLDLPRQGETWFVNESGLYNLIFRSDKTEAKTFRKWVTNEVLPALRKYGSYEVGDLSTHIINGKTWYNYKALLTRLGYSTKSGTASARRRRNPQEFMLYGSVWNVTDEFARYMMVMSRIRRTQLALRERKQNYENRQLSIF